MVHVVSKEQDNKPWHTQFSIKKYKYDKHAYAWIINPADYEEITLYEVFNKLCVFVYAVEEDTLVLSRQCNLDYLWTGYCTYVASWRAWSIALMYIYIYIERLRAS